jgi:hypothetical protein
VSTALVADDLERQIAHWLAAARTFRDAEEFASDVAWQSVETEIGMPLRRVLGRTVDDLLASGRDAHALVRAARRDASQLADAAARVQLFRRRYTRVEATLDFFGDAVNSRTNPTLRAALQSLDRLATASMATVLTPLGKPVPPVLTYVDKGLGASILRAGIRLWAPGSVNPVAAIKIVRHNLYRPTSLFHETGHQVAALTGWTEALSAGLGASLADDPQLRAMWQPWASEIAADVFAFAHTGYAAVAALYDVVGDVDTIHRWPLGDPHPVGWLRTLLGVAMCRNVFGPGPWDMFERAVVTAHPASRAEAATVPLLQRSQARMSAIAATCVDTAVPGFGGRPIAALVDPRRVSPTALTELERTAGPSLWTSPHWQRTDGIRVLALAGLREAEQPDHAAAWIDRARSWLTSMPQAA